MLFHVEDCGYSNRMMHNFNSFVKDKQNEADFRTVNLDQYPDLCTKFNISGVPSLLISKNGQEVRRIPGVVSKYNLDRIYNIMNN